ncbi:hypothetical protein BH10PSE13_BH10PSE13_15260 [soil metagenome]
MAINGDYASPVTINGYSCRNCTDVARAEKHIDPARPGSGPHGANDPKEAAKDHFSPEARNLDMLEELHRQQARKSSQIASSYGAVQSMQPGQFVNISA